MKRSAILMMALGFVFSWGCSRIEGTPLSGGLVEGIELSIKATLADAEVTRTVLNPDKNIYWTKDDAINLFYGDRSSGKFVSSVGDEPVKTTDFVGTLTVATGSSEEGMSARAFWGIYPYDENNTCDGSGVTMTLPSQQDALAGSFADKLNPSVATSAGLDLSFYNVGAPFYFSVTQEGVTSATFKGNNDEDVAGKIHITMDSEGKPVAEVLEGVKSITLTAPEGGFVPGETYVIVLLPQVQMTAGYTVTFRKGDLEGECVVSKSVKFERSKGRSKNNADEGLEYANPSYMVPELVDLGLSVKWASFNLGAIKPDDYGEYYAWGETSSKTDYIPYSYKWFEYDGGEDDYYLTKYCPYNVSGLSIPDGKTEFKDYDYEDDAAYINLGNVWRTPTDSEWTELREMCTWKWTYFNGRRGYLVTSNVHGYTEKTIFLPAAGQKLETGLSDAGTFGFYWSSNLSSSPFDAKDVYFYSSKVGRGDGWRCRGLSVRPVSGVFSPDELKVIGIKLDKDRLVINKGQTATLIVDVTPARATDKSVIWSSSNPTVAIVNSEGKITGLMGGVTTITVTTNDGNLTATCEITVAEAVDLGLSVNWATFNIGAHTPLEYGDLFAWGETESKDLYDWSTYKWCNGSDVTLTKYNTLSSYGSVDNKTTVDLEDDAAHVNWGGNWRMPSIRECQELINNCTSTWAISNGVWGVKLTSNTNGNSIFLPAAGCQSVAGRYGYNSICLYWSSSLYNLDPSISSIGPNHAYTMGDNKTSSTSFSWEVLSREFGFSIRPVCPKE